MNQPAPIVFVVDDDASVRKSLSRLLRSGGYTAETFASATEFLASGRHQQSPACLVLDVRMPGLTGMELQERLRALKSTLAIIFITGHGDIPTSVQAMKSGAVDFLPKPFDDTQLLAAVARAIAKSVHDRQTRAEIESIHERLATLTPREREVLELVVRGMLNKQVAADLGTVEKTIKVHRARVMEKMQVQSLAELVRFAERVGIGGASDQ
ncbi:MAG: response regulator transcription factor [Verrucomicrobiota bacterium]|jgi:FixJ family two-component response regulator